MGVVITDAWVEDVRIDGSIRSLAVNGVDVTAYIEGELDRRHQERKHLGADDVDGLRQASQKAIDRTEETVERARGLPESLLDEQGNDESLLSRRFAILCSRSIGGSPVRCSAIRRPTSIRPR